MNGRLLILTSFKTVRGFQKHVDSRTLLWGLDARFIEWELHQPWHPRPDLHTFDAVLSWTYNWQRNNFLFHCRKFERQCRRLGLPVVNSANGFSRYHSYFLNVWKRHGIPCALCQNFSDFSEVKISYPMILRRDGQHMGKDMFLVQTPEEAHRLIEKRQAAQDRAVAPLDLAIEFVDTRTLKGLYRKWRSYVIGDRVFPGHLIYTKKPLANFRDAVLNPYTCQSDAAFMQGGEANTALMLAATRALGYEMVALDYGKRPDGSYIFWEANRNFYTPGDPGFAWLPARRGDVNHGHAVADLVLQRMQAQHEPVAA